MMFLKVGKAKHKFKLKFTIAKYKYQPEQQIQKNSLFKVKVKRGSHQIQIFSTPVKKASIKFAKTQYMIPMTLFYDDSSNEYLEKQTQIKTYLCDENGNVLRSIGKTELNIAEYASKEKFGLQVQIQGENKKIKEDVVITFQMDLQRQDDDSKSVNTMSDDQQEYKSKQLNEKQSRNSKSKDKKGFLFPIAQSTVSAKSTQEKMKHSAISEMDEKFSQRTKKKNRENSPIKYLDEGRNENKTIVNENKTTVNEEQSQNQNFFSRFTNKQPKGQASITKDILKRRQKQKQKTKRTEQHQQTSSKTYTQDDETKNCSAQFRLQIATKKISSLQRENNQLKGESERLKQIIEQLISQKSQKQIDQNSSSSQVQQQIEQFKRSMIEKEMRINELQGLNKLVGSREEKKEREVKDLRGEVKELKLKLQHEKNKLAKVLQTAMESQNMELLQIVEKELNDQFY